LSVRRSTTHAALHKANREHGVGEPVVGELVSAAAPIDGKKKLAAARSGQVENGGGGSGLPGAALGLIVTAGLLGAGALVETRSLLR
jgi:hypothetical protein